MQKQTITIAVALTLLSGALPLFAGHRTTRGHWGETQVFRIDIGNFEPDGDSRYWDDKALDFTGDPEDFEDTTLSASYIKFIGDRLGLEINFTGFEGAADQAYLDFVDEFGADIFHTTQLDVTTLTLGLVANLAPRDAAIVPYIGAGGGLYSYELTEIGEFIDFDVSPPIVFDDAFFAEGDTLGYYWLAGLEIPIASSWSIFAEGRWHRADDDLEDDFDGFGELDLSGREISAGISWSF